MTAADLIQALGLPESTRVNQRVPKKLLAEHAAATAVDQRHIQDGVDEITWLAALKPHLIGVPAYEDEQRQYLELAVLSLTLKAGARPDRLVELLHRAVPYPVLLFTTSGAGVGLSLAHLRKSQNEADKTVLDGGLLFLTLPTGAPGDAVPEAFRDALALVRQPQTDLLALYQGWIDTLHALDMAQETGVFQPSLSRDQAAVRHAALHTARELRSRLVQLRAQATKERQLARQVVLNHEIKHLQRQLEAQQVMMKTSCESKIG